MTRTLLWVCVASGMVIAHWLPENIWGMAPTWKQVIEFSVAQAVILGTHWFWNRPQGYYPK
jgi:hypothetical protein